MNPEEVITTLVLLGYTISAYNSPLLTVLFRGKQKVYVYPRVEYRRYSIANNIIANARFTDSQEFLTEVLKRLENTHD